MTCFLVLRRWGQRAREVSRQRRLEERGDAMVFWCLLLALMLLPLGGLSVDLWNGTRSSEPCNRRRRTPLLRAHRVSTSRNIVRAGV